MRGGPQVTILWWQTINHEDHKDVWLPGVVRVGRVTQSFSITFEGSRTFLNSGHVAIDDISFTNCTLPGSSVQPGFPFSAFLLEAKFQQPLNAFTEPQPVCPDNMFKCINSVCIESNHLCDYSDDCGDHSDEIDCGEILKQLLQQSFWIWDEHFTIESRKKQKNHNFHFSKIENFQLLEMSLAFCLFIITK